MKPRSIERELALLVLGQISESQVSSLANSSFEALLNKALESLMGHWREGLDSAAQKLEVAQENLLETELQDLEESSVEKIRNHLKIGLSKAENVLNELSASLEFPRLLALSDQESIRSAVLQRVILVFEQRSKIDSSLDDVMEGWRLKRLPRVDRDILRLAIVDLVDLHTPIPVVCNEAVELANRYSDEQGRRMINGVLRRFQNASDSAIL